MADQFNILDYTGGPLLKTGQTTDFTPAGRTTKDDGGFQRGIAGSKADAQYEILTTGQYSGTTAITVNAIVDNHSNECVFDKVTGLMWSRNLTPLIYGAGTQGLLWDDTAGANEDIFKYCDQANLAVLSGFSDWRIPNITECRSLIIMNVSIGPPLINSTAFPIWKNGLIWSSTTHQGSTSNAFQPNFNNAAITSGVKTTSRQVTALVRLGIE